MNKKLKIPLIVIAILNITIFFLLTSLVNFINTNITDTTDNLNHLLTTDSRFTDLRDLDIAKLKEHSNSFDALLKSGTSNLPKPLNHLIYSSLDSRSLGTLRREVANSDITTTADLIESAKNNSIKMLKIISTAITLTLLLVSLIFYLILNYHFKSEERSRVKDEEALSQGKVLI